MKKLLLSSIIMLGVCGIAAAQSDSKVKPAEKNTISPAAATPQKSFTPASDAAPVGVVQTDGTVAAPQKAARVSKTDNAAGTVSPSDEAKKREEKLAKANEPAAPKVVLGKHKNKN